ESSGANRLLRLQSRAMEHWLKSALALISIAFYLLTWVLIPHVLLQRKQPLATLAWIWAILLFPFFGPMLYLLIGTERVQGRTRAGKNAIRGGPLPIVKHEPLTDWETESDQFVFASLENINKIGATAGNSTEFLLDGASFYPALEKAIVEAKHHI